MEQVKLDYIITNGKIVGKNDREYEVLVNELKEILDYFGITRVLIDIIIMYYLEIKKVEYKVNTKEGAIVEKYIEVKNNFVIIRNQDNKILIMIDYPRRDDILYITKNNIKMIVSRNKIEEDEDIVLGPGIEFLSVYLDKNIEETKIYYNYNYNYKKLKNKNEIDSIIVRKIQRVERINMDNYDIIKAIDSVQKYELILIKKTEEMRTMMELIYYLMKKYKLIY